MENSLVSVIVPIYNAEKALNECLDSIVSQTYEQIEVILVDDGSTDTSGAICDSYAENDSRVRVFHNTNHGVSYTRNFGVANAAGRYITFVDADDRIEPDAVELLVTAMEEHNTDLVFGGYGKFNDGHQKDYETRSILPADTAPSEGVFKSCKEIALLFTRARTSLSAVSVWGKLYRTELIRENNVRFPEDICYEEDCCFNIDYYRACSSAVTFKKAIYHYRQIPQSLSKSYDLKKFGYLVTVYNKRCEFLGELEMERFIPALRNIFILVLIGTYQKIEKTTLSRSEKIKNYQAISAMEDVRNIASTATRIPNRKLYKHAIKATIAGSGRQIWLCMRLWDLKNRVRAKFKIKAKLKKILKRKK